MKFFSIAFISSISITFQVCLGIANAQTVPETVSNENKATTELFACQTSKEGNSPKRRTFITPNPVAEANQEITIAAQQTFPPQNSAQNSLTELQYISCRASALSGLQASAFDLQASAGSGQLAKIDSAKLHFSSQGEADSLGKLLAQGDPGLSSDVGEAARKSANPLGGDFLIFLNQIDNYFLGGDATDETKTLNVWSVQPVISIPIIGENWIWVTRPTFPFVMHADLPDIDRIRERVDARPDIPETGFPGSGFPPGVPGGLPRGGLPFTGESGFGDMVVFSLLGQSLPKESWGGGDLVWGLGPTFQFPTASDRLGSEKWSIGPSGVLAFIGRKFIIGGLSQNWFSFAGDDDAQDVSFSWLNIFYFLNFENGWQVGGTPILTLDWNADLRESNGRCQSAWVFIKQV